MTITIEMIDELKKRANVSFKDAKEALEKYDGDLVEALVYLENNNKFKAFNAGKKEDFLDKVKEVIRKGNNTRFIIRKKERTILNLSLTFTIIVGVFTFHVSLVALIIGLLTGCKFRFEKNSGEDMKVNSILNKVHDNINNFKKDLHDDVPTEKE